MQIYFRLSLATIASLLIFLSISCNTPSDSKSNVVSYNELIEDLKNPSNELKSKQVTLLLDNVIEASKTLPLQKIIIGKEERSLSPERGHLLLAVIESDLAKKHLDYIYQRANFDKVYIADKKLENAYLPNVILTHSYLSNITLIGTDLSQATLTNTRFVESKISNSNFDKTICRRSNFLNSTIDNTTFNSSYLRDASFTGTIVSQINLEGANLSGVVGLEKMDTKELIADLEN